MNIKNISFYEHEFKKSRFISFAFVVECIKDFELKLDEIRKNHIDAKHICYGYKIFDNGLKMKVYNSSEPKGSASLPIHSTIERSDLNNIAIIIVRYFGKSKIGKTNLYRSYLKSSTEALNLLINTSNNNR